MTSDYAVLLAGGSGTRLWPVSRELYPKQLSSFIGDDSLVQSTLKRLIPVIDPTHIRIVCGEEHYFEIERHMAEIDIPSKGRIIREPCGRNTAPAILLGVLQILETVNDAVIWVFPADHVIRDVAVFHDKLAAAARLARSGHIVTFGIQPDYPETGYGYIEGDKLIEEGARRVRRFVEKPDLETASAYLAAGNFFWNSGMFAFQASVILEEFERFCPNLLREMKHLVSAPEKVLREGYEKLENISIDYAIMERTDHGVVLPVDFGWSDIGSWKSLYDFLPKDSDGNVFDGDIIALDTRQCLIRGHGRLIAANGLKNIVIVETPDSVFVSDLESSRDVKEIVVKLKDAGRREYRRHRTNYSASGTRTLLEKMGTTAVFRRSLYPGAKWSIESGKGFIHHLIVVAGTAKLAAGGGGRVVEAGENLIVPEAEGAILENIGSEVLILVHVECAFS